MTGTTGFKSRMQAVSTAKPTKQDAEVLLKLVEIIRAPDIQESRNWILREFAAPSYEEFKSNYPEGSLEYNPIRNLLDSEISGVLVSHKFRLSTILEEIGPNGLEMAEGNDTSALGERRLVRDPK